MIETPGRILHRPLTEPVEAHRGRPGTNRIWAAQAENIRAALLFGLAIGLVAIGLWWLQRWWFRPRRLVKVHQNESNGSLTYGTFSARLRHTIMDEAVASTGHMVASAGARA